ncbi:putative disease resistance protein RGA1 [Silene latifolia]|uniref:putative disease resistance protein RGA1 n=1 Tax=Silene latifolia TaxID=37657 RepID=UPI003D770E69
MDVSTTLSLVQTILAAIQTLGQLQAVYSVSNCKSELDDLQNTVETVRAVLMDADAKQDSLNFQEQNYVKELKDVVYDADDVFDEFLTLVKNKQQLKSNKVKSFFSRFKLLTHKLSSKVKAVNDKLDTIATKSNMFSFKVDFKPKKLTKEETSSCLSEVIIGREEDVEKIIDVLLGSSNVDHPPVSLLAIMGMGGLGKTTLAKLVYNDPRISEAFQLKRWTCIADQDQQQLDLKQHLWKVVKGLSVSDKTSLEDIHHEVKEQLGGKKYLLVLDDVWTESYDEWQKLEGFLKVGGRGSWIIVTTRSKTTAQMVGGDQVHELQGLSKIESWHLFERMAFQAQVSDDELVKLGKKIVKKCTNVPLAIRVVGSLLRGQSISKWLSFHDKGLDYLSENNDTMTPILKLSYNQLNPSLKACFAYCAIFPKDWQINKQMLIRLWMAQGYIDSENLGEEYFLILLQRCFFQDIVEDKFEEIVSFKVHDLLHDIAEKVAGEEICRFNFDTSNVSKRVRHMSFVSDSYAQYISNNTHIRTCLQINESIGKSKVEQLLESKSIPNWTCLRSLDLSYSGVEKLPEAIGQLLHLRSLDLSSSRNLKALPKSITKLVNLQTLNLFSCDSLRQLPDDMSKLIDLSTLDIRKCNELSYMPTGIGTLTCLHTLCLFVVGLRGSSSSKQCFNGLEDLQHLNKLKGRLKIEIAVLKNAKFVKEKHGGGAYLKGKEYVETIGINFRRWRGLFEGYGSKESEQALMEEMQPHHGVKTFKLRGYHGETIPRWLGKLLNLVTLKIQDCDELLNLPWEIAKLPHLKTLDILELRNLEYLVDANLETVVSSEGSSFFPSLDKLYMYGLPQLKGWWRSESGSQVVIKPYDGGSSGEAHIEWVSSPCFPLLRNLTIELCQKMMPIEYSHFLEKIHIKEVWTMESLGEAKEFPTSLLSSLKFMSLERCPKLKRVGGWLEHLSTLEYLRIDECPKVELGGMSWHNLAATLHSLELFGLEEMEELPEGIQYCTSLKYLYIISCPKLKSMPKWMPKLTSLQVFYISLCSESLKERCQKLNGEDWPLIQHISSFGLW